MKADLYNLNNDKVGTIELSSDIFETAWKPALVRQVLLAQMANARDPWAHAKGRSEVRGGGRKPWRQKGTGRARHGSTRSPLWIGGGKAHGPTKEKDYSQKVNKQMKRTALLSAISKKFKGGEIKIMESLALEAPKTKMDSVALHKVLAVAPKIKKFDVLIIPSEEDKGIFRAARNLGKTKVLAPASLNLYDILNYKNVLLDQKAIAVITKNYLQA